VKVDLTRVDSEAVPGVRDAKLLPSSRAIRAALVKTGETKMDRGMLAKAEWERQLRAKIQERERQQLEYEQAIPAAETPVELGVRQDERLLALELIKQDMEGGRLCDRSHAPALPEEEEIELEDSIDKQDDSTGLPTSSSKGSSPEDQLDEDGKLLGKFLADNGFDDPHQGRRRVLANDLSSARGSGERKHKGGGPAAFSRRHGRPEELLREDSPGRGKKEKPKSVSPSCNAGIGRWT